MSKYSDGYNDGAKYVRDTTLALIIGLQNKNGNQTQSEHYKAQQEVYDTIANVFGDMFENLER
jgi:hypothetical protein